MEVGHDLDHAAPADEPGEIEPVRPDVRHRPQLTRLLWHEPPVPVGRHQEPILEVAPCDKTWLADPAAADMRPCLVAGGIEADVEAERVDETARACSIDQVGGVRARQRQRLLADDMFAGLERRADLLGVGVVRGRDVDRVDGRVGERVLEAVVDARQRRRRGLQACALG